MKKLISIILIISTLFMASCKMQIQVSNKLYNNIYVEFDNVNKLQKAELRLIYSETDYNLDVYKGKYYLSFNREKLNKRYGFFNHKRVIKRKYKLLNELP